MAEERGLVARDIVYAELVDCAPAEPAFMQVKAMLTDEVPPPLEVHLSEDETEK